MLLPVVRVALLITSLLALLPLPATATEDVEHLELSLDGEIWKPTLTTPLFEPQMLVPADRLRRSFWVHNGSAGPALLTVSVLDTSHGASNLSRNLTVAVGSPNRPGQPRGLRLDHAGGCSGSMHTTTLAVGEKSQVEVTLTFEDVDLDIAQADAAAFDLMATLSDVSPSGAALTGCPHAADAAQAPACTPGLVTGVGAIRQCGSAAPLPDTGAPRGLLAMLTGTLVLMLTGAFLIAVRSRGTRRPRS